MQTEQDLEKLVRTYTPALLRYCTGILGSEHDAQDAVQQTFIKAWQRRHTLHNPHGQRDRPCDLLGRMLDPPRHGRCCENQPAGREEGESLHIQAAVGGSCPDRFPDKKRGAAAKRTKESYKQNCGHPIGLSISNDREKGLRSSGKIQERSGRPVLDSRKSRPGVCQDAKAR